MYDLDVDERKNIIANVLQAFFKFIRDSLFISIHGVSLISS